jgi:predicted Zn-dependent protease
MNILRRRILAAVFVCIALALTACAVNPATGKKQFVLMSEQQEIAIGRENDEAISAQLGIYDDRELQDYVQRLGTHLAAKSERPDLDWTFRVLNDPVINAFALPGGYIYVTRGIMTHLDSEAALCSVIGHEIGHVTARHSVSQMSKAQLAQLGLGLGSVLAPEQMERFGGLAVMGMGMLFLKYSRDDERQADDLGLRYLVRGEYDPHPMPEVFDMLGRVSEAAGQGRVPAWQTTHPRPENRSQRISDQIAALGQDFSRYAVNREEFLRQVDGIVFGEDPRQGYFKENLFLHPEMRFRFEFPGGWKLVNQTQAVVGVSGEEDAIVQITLSDKSTADEALRGFLELDIVTRAGGWDRPVRNLTSAGAAFTVDREQGSLRGLAAFVEHEGKVFQLLGYTPQDRWSGYESGMRRSLASFDRLTDRRYIDVLPKRVQVVRPGRSMGLSDFADRYDATAPLETLALINGIETNERLRGDRSYKVVVGGKLP